jgi:hypothetical protein
MWPQDRGGSARPVREGENRADRLRTAGEATGAPAVRSASKTWPQDRGGRAATVREGKDRRPAPDASRAKQARRTAPPSAPWRCGPP